MAGGMINLVRIIETRPPEVAIRRWREVRKGTMRLMGLHWHQNMLPLHFEPNAANVYHYQRRTKKYLERKAKANKQNPLLYSGTLRANVTQIATIRVFEQRFKLVMPGTAYTPDRPRRPNQPPIAQEVTRLLEREKAELSKLGKAFAVEALKSIKSPTTTTIQ